MAFNSNGGLTPNFLDELKFKCDIVSIISGYIRLEKKGGKYFGCCPFHNEKTPSFCVNADEQYYHCFGCGVSGNVINFVMEMESLSFYEAVKYLAEKAGISEVSLLHIECGSRGPSYQTIYNIAEALDASIDFLSGRVNKPEEYIPTPEIEEHGLTEKQSALMKDIAKALTPIVKKNI